MAGRVYLMRHAEAESQEKDARLSARGKYQARHAAMHLVADLWNDSWPDKPAVQLYYSPTPRAVETHEIFYDRILTQDYWPVRMMDSKPDERIAAGGVIGPLMKTGVSYEDCVQHWLQHPNCVPGKEPPVLANRLGEVVRECLETDNDEVILLITHEIPLAAFLQLLGFESDACGVRNCEWLRLGADHEHKALMVGFREQTHRFIAADYLCK